MPASQRQCKPHEWTAPQSSESGPRAIAAALPAVFESSAPRSASSCRRCRQERIHRRQGRASDQARPESSLRTDLRSRRRSTCIDSARPEPWCARRRRLWLRDEPCALLPASRSHRYIPLFISKATCQILSGAPAGVRTCRRDASMAIWRSRQRVCHAKTERRIAAQFERAH